MYYREKKISLKEDKLKATQIVKQGHYSNPD